MGINLDCVDHARIYHFLLLFFVSHLDSHMWSCFCFDLETQNALCECQHFFSSFYHRSNLLTKFSSHQSSNASHISINGKIFFFDWNFRFAKMTKSSDDPHHPKIGTQNTRLMIVSKVTKPRIWYHFKMLAFSYLHIYRFKIVYRLFTLLLLANSNSCWFNQFESAGTSWLEKAQKHRQR